MAHPLVATAASCLVEGRDGMMLAESDRLDQAIEEWARRPTGREAIGELVRFAIHLDERWGATAAARALIDGAGRVTHLLAAELHRDPTRRIVHDRATDLGLVHRAPRFDEPPSSDAIPGHVLMRRASILVS